MKRNLISRCFILLTALTILSCAAGKDTSKNALFKTRKGEQKYINAYNKSLRLWPVPYTEQDIPTTFGTVHAVISGPVNAEPLVLLHGMDASSTMWYLNVKDYSKNYRVYAIDYIMEAGKSSLKENRNLNSDEIVQLYNETFDGLKLTNINLLGTSRGGWIATLYAIHHKERIKKLALLAPVQTFKMISMNSDLINAANFKIAPTRNRLKKLVHDFSLYPEKIDPVVKDQIYFGNKYTKTKLDLFSMTPFSDDELKSLDLPVLVLVGDHDILSPITIIEIAAEKIPNSHGAVIETAGHFLTVDRAEEVDKRVLEFLSEK
ncbi:alpha/beta hydrolase [Flavobacterium sp. DG1-102-2]|uniref:alpha/beta fold hydrolase n=1 Tax=Flavobacterium sp. DG1-102-2 TaxID=3081663 RepID=UPI002948EE5A|nr:alpha/beta hydrolase [Flavobacterium sp. DG1-102-2]MDV6169946.1 alpha/beta hydrolase [Flavobacterium sp. DG1-102-2]